MFDFCCVSIGDLTRDCHVFLKDRQVSSLGASFSIFACFVFEIWVLRASVFVFEFRVLRFRGLGASFSTLGCLVLRSSFLSPSFSKLPL